MSATPYLKPTTAFDRREMGKYEVLCRLSTGGMSEIFLAHQKGLAGFRKLVVLKSILPDIRGEEEFVRMFLDEARTTALFNHPHIAQVFDLDIDADSLFLAMEFVEGCTLVEMARACRQAKEPIPVGFTLLATRDTALALHYAHNFTDPRGRRQTVIHRDVAEKNIMVTFDGTTKLLDFGIAKALGGAATGRTSIGMVKGTSGYMSPEQIRGEPLDARSDVFALGVVLHECLTAMRLFHGKTPEDAMLAALREEIPPPSRQNPLVTPALDAVVLKALQRDRDSRYSTSLEFARAIERAAADMMWLPEQSGDLVVRHFADRREQTRALMEETGSTEHTGELRIEKLLESISARNEDAARPPTPPSQKGPLVSAGLIAPPQRRTGAISNGAAIATPRPSAPPRESATGAREPSVITEPGAHSLSPLPAPPSPPSVPWRGQSMRNLPAVAPSIPPVTASDFDFDDDDDEPGAKTIPAAILSNGMFAPPDQHRPVPSAPTIPPPVPRASVPPPSSTADTSDSRTVTADTVSVAAVAPRREDTFDDDQDVKTTIARPFDEKKPKKPIGLFIALAGAAVFALVAVLLLVLQVGPFAPPTQPPMKPFLDPKPKMKTGGQQPKTDVKPVEPAPVVVQPTTPPPVEKKPDPVVVAVPVPPTPVVAAAPKPKPTRTPKQPRAKQPEEDTETVAPAATGKLTLVTEPPGLLVLLGGQELGATPLFGKDLPSGRQSLKLVSSSQVTKTLVVDIKPGQLSSIRQDFEALR